MIEIVNLSKNITNKRYKTTTNILHNISLTLPNKGLIFVLGKSGSGKTTLLNILGGLDNFSEGDILINKVSTKKFKQKDFDNYRNGSMGFIFQDFYLLEDINVAENLMLPLQLQGKKTNISQVSGLLDKLELSGFEKRRINEISSGQKQRIAIARAIVKNPKVILADEPTGSLDSETAEQIFNILKDISKEKLVIVVTHDKESAYFYGDRVIELKDGKLLQDRICGSSLNHKKETTNTSKLKNLALVNKEKLFVPVNEKYFNNISKNNDNLSFQPIKSHLSFKLSFLMGTSFFKEKKISLIFIVLFTSGLYFFQNFINLFSILVFKFNSFISFLEQRPREVLRKLYNNYEEFNSAKDTIIICNRLIMGISLIILLCTMLFIGGFVKKSIQFKKKDIGVLRSLGARSIDVFKIFFSEGLVLTFLVTIISFVVVCWTKIPMHAREWADIGYEFYRDCMSSSPVIQEMAQDQNIAIIKTFFIDNIIEGIRYWVNIFTRYDVLFLTQFFFVLLSIIISIVLPIYKFARKKPIDIILNK